MNEQKKKILLVEDDMALAAVYRSRLEIEGFDVREVHNGEDALSATVEYRPDLILLDVMMPKDKERAESLGVDDYLVKSQVVIGDVVARVKHHLNMQ